MYSLFNMPLTGSWAPWLVALAVWSIVWKGLGLWKAGRNNQLIWFLAMFLFNTAGILPIVYILWFQKAYKETIVLPKAKRKPAKKEKAKKR